jgi:hypothetical protein
MTHSTRVLGAGIALLSAWSAEAGVDGGVVRAVVAQDFGAIEGVVTASSRPPDVASTQDMWLDRQCPHAPANLPWASIDAPRRAANAIVWMVTTTALPAAREQTLHTKDCQFEAQAMVLEKGDTLAWATEGPSRHKLMLGYEDRLPGGYLLPTFSREISTGVTPIEGLTRLGTYGATCIRHPWETLAIVVTNNPFFAFTDGEGHFRIEKAPVGRYTLIADHRALVQGKAQVTVRAGGTTRADFVLAPRWNAADRPCQGSLLPHALKHPLQLDGGA